MTKFLIYIVLWFASCATASHLTIRHLEKHSINIAGNKVVPINKCTSMWGMTLYAFACGCLLEALKCIW